MILRRVARPLLAAVFVSGGIQTLRNPKPPTEAASPVLDRMGDSLPAEPMSVVKLDAAVKVGAGLTLGFGKLPRLSALLLASSLVPTTAVHRFWDVEDPGERAAQMTHFLKNLGLLGGLLIAAADTHGKPSLTWRARRATRAATHDAANAVRRLT
jgi:putative oxidoreductase